MTRMFPREEQYGLTSQMRRAAVSIPSNIAEGYGRRTKPDYIRSLHVAYGSVCELETQMSLARDLDFAPSEESEEAEGALLEVERMLKALIKSLHGEPRMTASRDLDEPSIICGKENP